MKKIITSKNYRELQEGIYTDKLRRVFTSRISFNLFISAINKPSFIEKAETECGVNLCNDVDVYNYMEANGMGDIQVPFSIDLSNELNNGYTFIVHGEYFADLCDWDSENNEFTNTDYLLSSIEIEVESELED